MTKKLLFVTTILLALAFAASLRCHDCRACRAPLQAELVEQARHATGPGALLLQLPADHPYDALAA